MCKIYNPIGSLTTLKAHLDRHNINDFKSLKDVIDFQSSYLTYQQQIINHHQKLIEQEKDILYLELQQLKTSIEIQKKQIEKALCEEIDKLNQQLNTLITFPRTNYFKRLGKYLKQLYYRKKINYNQCNFDFRVKKSINKSVDFYQHKSNRYQFIVSQFGDAVKESSQQYLTELKKKKAIVDELNPFIYGALGEQKVVRTLESLSDEFFLINDFAIALSTPIYYRQEYIRSIQIDHILIAPSGIFLIETKNWSKKSIEDLSLHSPVQQIKRTSFVLFKLLNNELINHHLDLDKHHWGDRKISIRNLIVMINTKPKQEFQFVKILTVNELIGYIRYFKPIFSNLETRSITNYLLNINHQKQ